MSTSHEFSLLRQMTTLEYLIKEAKPLRLQDFDPMLKDLRNEGNWQLFPLNATTVKSSLKALVKGGLVNAEAIQVYRHRTIIFYTPTTSGHGAWQAWNGAN